MQDLQAVATEGQLEVDLAEGPRGVDAVLDHEARLLLLGEAGGLLLPYGLDGGAQVLDPLEVKLRFLFGFFFFFLFFFSSFFLRLLLRGSSFDRVPVPDPGVELDQLEARGGQARVPRALERRGQEGERRGEVGAEAPGGAGGKVFFSFWGEEEEEKETTKKKKEEEMSPYRQRFLKSLLRQRLERRWRRPRSKVEGGGESLPSPSTPAVVELLASTAAAAADAIRLPGLSLEGRLHLAHCQRDEDVCSSPVCEGGAASSEEREERGTTERQSLASDAFFFSLFSR